MTRTVLVLLALLAALPAAANDLAKDLAPTGTLRVIFIGRNPVQATIDAKTGEARGPAAEIARMIAEKVGVAVTIAGVANGPAVIESVKSGAADIGFVAFDPVRAAEVDFAQAYSLVQQAYAVPEASPIRVQRRRGQDRAYASASASAMRGLLPDPLAQARRVEAQFQRQQRCCHEDAHLGRGRCVWRQSSAHDRGGREHAGTAAFRRQLLCHRAGDFVPQGRGGAARHCQSLHRRGAHLRTHRRRRSRVQGLLAWTSRRPRRGERVAPVRATSVPPPLNTSDAFRTHAKSRSRARP